MITVISVSGFNEACCIFEKQVFVNRVRTFTLEILLNNN